MRKIILFTFLALAVITICSAQARGRYNNNNNNNQGRNVDNRLTGHGNDRRHERRLDATAAVRAISQGTAHRTGERRTNRGGMATSYEGYYTALENGSYQRVYFRLVLANDTNDIVTLIRL